MIQLVLLVITALAVLYCLPIGKHGSVAWDVYNAFQPIEPRYYIGHVIGVLIGAVTAFTAFILSMIKLKSRVKRLEDSMPVSAAQLELLMGNLDRVNDLLFQQIHSELGVIKSNMDRIESDNRLLIKEIEALNTSRYEALMRQLSVINSGRVVTGRRESDKD